MLLVDFNKLSLITTQLMSSQFPDTLLSESGGWHYSGLILCSPNYEIVMTGLHMLISYNYDCNFTLIS